MVTSDDDPVLSAKLLIHVKTISFGLGFSFTLKNCFQLEAFTWHMDFFLYLYIFYIIYLYYFFIHVSPKIEKRNMFFPSCKVVILLYIVTVFSLQGENILNLSFIIKVFLYYCRIYSKLYKIYINILNIFDIQNSD